MLVPPWHAGMAHTSKCRLSLAYLVRHRTRGLTLSVGMGPARCKDTMSTTAHATREAWLEAAVEAMRPWLIFDGAPRVSVGFPASGGLRVQGSRTIGQCWSPKAASDGRSQIYVSPLLDDASKVLAVLLHELIHHKVGNEAGHGKPFKREMRHVGLEGKATATVPGAQCAAVLAKVAEELGPYPHAALNPKLGRKVQGTRLLKAQCEGCGCVVRITAQWAGANGETLPICGYCAIDGNPDTFVRLKLAL